MKNILNIIISNRKNTAFSLLFFIGVLLFLDDLFELFFKDNKTFAQIIWVFLFTLINFIYATILYSRSTLIGRKTKNIVFIFLLLFYPNFVFHIFYDGKNILLIGSFIIFCLLYFCILPLFITLKKTIK